MCTKLIPFSLSPFRDVISKPNMTPDLEVRTPNLINLNTVDNIHQWLKHPDHIYIGRESMRHLLDESIWGNPFKIGSGKTREEVIVLYKNFILNNEELSKSVPQLTGKTLGCWCSPKPCHGEFLHYLAGNIPVHQSQ